ncbi:ComF family protein [Polaribacter vadi]|uniref:ComF family protein n=1 Tax=Polaribacter TaxID=52959 RepID=UPI001C09B26A|nr:MULTISPECIES: ComF family protein [Polaribacter]MBU3010224.1 ComF family protein [Polaribacter vadi]MDO6740030.1 ComF family protein [Polaribacter sp. 1_MG-2023]
MRILKDLFYIFYPKLCVVCDEHLLENENIICTLCRHDLPLTNFNDYKNNKVTQTFYGSVTIDKGYALLFYRKEGSTLNLIHDLKYKDNENIGVFFGNWLGEILKENSEFKDVDYIIPVPLHPKKLRERGYNQVTKFGKRLNFHLNIPLIENELIRISSTKTQTFKSRFERFRNLDTKFSLSNPSQFNNKHILLIDDVITTGATLKACAKEFQKSENCKISVLTMAYTE